jgi:hypothetical protein
MNKKDLLKQLGSKAGPQSSRASKDEPKGKSDNVTLAPEPAVRASSTTGKTTAFWLDEAQRQILREVSIMMINHGLKPSDSLAVRAAIELMPRGPQFIDKVRELIEKDGRKPRNKPK